MTDSGRAESSLGNCSMVSSIYSLYHSIKIKTISFPSLGDKMLPSQFEAYRFIHVCMFVTDICF